MPDTPQVSRELAHLIYDLRLDLRSLVTCVPHARPGYRDVVIRAKGEQAEALARELRARYGESVSVLIT